MSKNRLLKGRAPIISHQTKIDDPVPLPDFARARPLPDIPVSQIVGYELEQKTPDWVMQLLPVGVGFLIGVVVTLLLVTLGL
jgi:hypothetical protein